MRYRLCIHSLTPLLMAVALSGCSLFQAAIHHDETAQYAESVFRHQNTVISQIMMLTEEEQMPDDPRLTEAEQQMHEACHLLNQYAEHDSDGETMTLAFKRQVLDSVKGCNQRIEQLELLLAPLKNAVPQEHDHE